MIGWWSFKLKRKCFYWISVYVTDLLYALNIGAKTTIWLLYQSYLFNCNGNRLHRMFQLDERKHTIAHVSRQICLPLQIMRVQSNVKHQRDAKRFFFFFIQKRKIDIIDMKRATRDPGPLHSSRSTKRHTKKKDCSHISRLLIDRFGYEW